MIPGTIEDVTPDWLGEVLCANIQDLQLTQIGQGVGLMGDIYRVAIQFSENAAHLPDSVVVKLPSSFEDTRAQGIALGMFESEVRFYNELGPQASVGLPQIYFADIASGTAEFVVVMEDLSHLTLVDQIIGMTFEQALASVKVLANIHAVWWDRVQTPELEWIPSMVGPRIEFVDDLLTQIYPGFAEGFGRYLPDGGLEVYEKFSGNYLKINTALANRSPWTLAHQDYRVENIMFGETGEVVVLDWQGIGRGPGVYDLAYILGGSMYVGLRRANELALVQAYHDQLTKAGVEDYSFEQVWDDYGLAHLMGGLATSMVTAGTIDLSNDRGHRLVETMANRHVTAALDHDGLARLASVT
jgi:hypothetical protein